MINFHKFRGGVNSSSEGRSGCLRSCFPFVSAFFLFLAATAPAHADCTNPPGPESKIIYNGDQNVPQICTGNQWVALGVLNPAAGGAGCTNPSGPEGKVMYNGDIHKPQYCDGDDWVEMIGTIGTVAAGCGAPSSCSNIGDVCADGSLFAGFMFYGATCKQVFVTDNNQSLSSQWKNATGTDDISTDDHVDGQVNHAGRGGTLSNFPAFDLCESNTYHGKSDWYLPARAELNLLWLNRAAIDAGAAGNFTTSNYWSSTEYGTSDAWYQNFGSGGQDGINKTNNYDVRCVRAEVAPTATGLTGPSGCANIGDLCADGTVFAGWHPITYDHLFIPTTNQEQPGAPGTYTMNWKNADGTDDISTDSDDDGQINHTNRGGAIGDFQAFQACEDLGFGGHGDWYLPSRVELHYLWSVRGTIEAGGNITNFQSAYYWSSTESGTNSAMTQSFANGTQGANTKGNTFRVRCVRR
jgi:hypothetical protein